MQTVTTIGFDIAKSVFQVHGVDAGGQMIIRRQLKRRHVLAFCGGEEPRGKSGELVPVVRHGVRPSPAAAKLRSSSHLGHSSLPVCRFRIA